MKYFNLLLISIVLLASCSISAQVSFSKLPQNKQLIGRKINNKGDVVISGQVKRPNVSYQSIEIDILRNNTFLNKVSNSLNYTNNIASFNFTIEIQAELANFSFKIYGKNGTNRTLLRTVNEVVAGDAYIISGQSNAGAPNQTGQSNNSSDAYNSNFTRVYSGSYNSAVDLRADNQWSIADGDGGSRSTGQWGVVLAKQLIDKYKIPVAILTSARGGKGISFFARPNNYKTSQESKYGKMYYRATKSGLQNHIKAILWCQGEQDALVNVGTQNYINSFKTLLANWKQDFPNIQHTFTFQLRNGCAGTALERSQNIKEAQRRIADGDNKISVMALTALPMQGSQDFQNCHFLFKTGYEQFGLRVAKQVQKELFNETGLGEVNPPMIKAAVLTGNTQLTIQTDATSLSRATTQDYFLNNAGGATITDVSLSGGNIVFSLSKKPTNGATISYTGRPGVGNGQYIVNSNNLEVLCFEKFPITEGTITPPNPTSIAIPGTIEAESFVTKNGGVKAENTPGGGQNLGFITNSNYTEYSINVSKTGTYKLDVFTSSNGVGGNIVTSIGGNNLVTLVVPVNNDWHNYTTPISGNINLTAGIQKIRFTYTGSTGFLFNFDRAILTLDTPIDSSDCSSAPTGFAITSVTDTSVTLSIDNTSDDTRTFEVRTYTGGTFNNSLNGAIGYKAAPAGSTSITITNLKADTSYDFGIRALCNPGGSPLASVSGTTSGGTTTPVADCSKAPTNLLQTTSSETSITVTYDNTTNDNRIFELRAFPEGTFTGNINTGVAAFASGTAGSTSITINDLKINTQYDLVLRALCGSGNPPSPVATIVGKTTDGNTSIPETVDLSPIDDAYLQGSTSFNNTILRTEKGNRVSYLKFDVSAINEPVTAATLKLTVNGDSGNGNIEVNLGNSNNWTEANLNTTNAPAKGALLGNLNKTYSLNQAQNFTLSNLTINGNFLSLVVTQINGNDVSFASKENTSGKPVLTITYNSTTRAKDELNVSHIKAFPNPVHNTLDLDGLSGKSIITIMDLKGKTILIEKMSVSQNTELDVSQLSKGMYFVQIQNGIRKTTLKIIKD